ncbi:MAG: type II toxin-antitoxin system RelE/ParE family toxin [Thermoplasmataceae archaeon]
MPCKEYSLDISAIESYIQNSDGSIKSQIIKKIKKVKRNPFLGETKSHELKGIRAVKVNNQKIVILFRLDNEDPCRIVFIEIGTHDDVYKNTY